jgi:Domain of unknown function (DUF4281)
MMNWESLFGIANALALASWATVIAAPRRAILLRVVRYGVIGLYCLAYSTLILLYFFRVEGGGFGSLHEVKVLFTSDPVVLAGWLHYLAFDLFVGLWIAQRADVLGVSRLIQAPLLIATFMFGPVGLLVASVIGLSGRRNPAQIA